MKYLISLVFFLIFLVNSVDAQKKDLAMQYYQNGEYEKAAQLYSSLYQTTNNLNYFNNYIQNLELFGNSKEAIQELKKEIKKLPGELTLYVTLGGVLEKEGLGSESDRYYEDAINLMPPIPNEITKVAYRFQRYAKYDLAIKAFEKGLELIGPRANYYYSLGNIYRKKSETKSMIQNYILALKHNPGYINSIENTLQDALEPEDFKILQSEIFLQLQEKDNRALSNLLIWSYIYTKRYSTALRQVIAMDKRNGEAGQEVIKVGKTIQNERSYSTAIKAYQYVLEEKGNMSPYFFNAKENLFEAQREEIVATSNSKEDFLVLKKEIKSHLKEYDKNKNSAGIIRNLAKIEALNLNQMDSAIILLANTLNIGELNLKEKAEIKLDLGDYYLINNERWESTLLYSQVDKDFEEDPLGHEARYRNAKLAYYMGDFEWAQVQFDVLKASTSKLISNNAIDMSVFIQDNLGLDTNEVALSMFARSDLFAIQNQQDSALFLLRQLKLTFPDHDLLDDVIYREANIYSSLKDYEKSIERYEYLIKNYNEDIKADNSLFELAEIYDYILLDKEKAQVLYERIFMDYDSSTFSVEARKRYRQLRGDQI